MIAKNYRRFPEAMALQLVLVFGRPVWNTSRPSSRLGRALRYAQAALVKSTPQLVTWRKKPTPAWCLAARRAAKKLADEVRQALEVFVWDMAELAGPASRECAKTKVFELLEHSRKTHGMNMYQPFTWPILTHANYPSWVNYGTRENFWPLEKRRAYRD